MVVGALMIAILALTLIFLQQRFDQSDLDKAVAMLAEKPDGGWSVAEELDARGGASSAICSPRIVSSFRGTLEVSCTAGASEPYRFGVDLVRHTVKPLNAQAEELLQAVERRNAGGAPDSGVGPADAGSTDAG